MTAFAMELS